MIVAASLNSCAILPVLVRNGAPDSASFLNFFSSDRTRPFDPSDDLLRQKKRGGFDKHTGGLGIAQDPN